MSFIRKTLGSITGATAAARGAQEASATQAASAEKGIHHYEVERASGDQLYRNIATIDARGQMYSYRFVDEDALMKGDKQQIVGNVYSYRLRAIGYDNSSSVSNSVSVAHSISGIRRTWGMIKEMFR